MLFSILLIFRELFSLTLLITAFLGFLLKNRKWKIAALIILVLSVLELILEIVSSPAPRSLQISDILIGFPFSTIVMGVPLLLLIGIPAALILGFKQKDLKIKLFALWLFLFGVLWWVGIGYWIGKM